ncbi:hypothetical protein, partial [Rhodoferax sp.]|uniref:hypothetical protein n=1 Tax=Rhodoferax sp. TaxID=50421 RepID=UPI00272051FC
MKRGIEFLARNAIIQGFAGKPPLPDQLFSGEHRTIFFNWPDLPLAEVCIFWTTLRNDNHPC